MRLVSSLALASLLAACGHSHAGEDNSPQGTRNFDATGFDSVSLAGSDDVDVTVGPAFSISATGPQAVLDRLEIKVDGSNLKIGRKNSASWNWNSRGATIRVTMPSIKGATIAGSADMSIDKVEGQSFDAGIAGSGNLRVKAIKVETLKAGIVGSGDANLGGTANSVDLSIAGSGNVEADDLKATNASVSILGSGDIRLHVTGSANGSVAGSGDVNIRGIDKCTVSKAGSGSVNCKL